MSRSTASSVGLKRFFSCDSATRSPAANTESRSTCSYGASATASAGGAVRVSTHGPEDALVVARDPQVAAHGEVDEGGDVDEVDLLVDDRADHAGLHSCGRRNCTATVGSGPPTTTGTC